MLKTLLVMSLFNSYINVDYVELISIEHYQTNKSDKELIFNFDSDLYKVHTAIVTLDIYNLKDNANVATYQNKLDFIGEKKATAKFSLDKFEEFYILIDVQYNEIIILEDVRINCYIQENCTVSKGNYDCNRIYKSEYRDGISKDLVTNLRIKNDIFDQYLVSNYLNPNNIFIYSDYDFKYSNSYLKVDGYKYKMPLNIEGSKKYYFDFCNVYYIDMLNYRFSESYFDNSNKTKYYHFPYSQDYKKYNCIIVIEDFIRIEINFDVYVYGNLIGNCENSKYCLKRIIYD